MFSKDKMNLIGGVPDILFTKIGKVLLKKSSKTKEVYKKSLEFYLKYKVDARDNSLFVLPEKAPSFQRIEIEIGTDYCFKSEYTPRNSTIIGEFSSYKLNSSTSVRIFEHNRDEKPPIVLCLHGFMLGNRDIVKKMFKVDKLFGKGVDVAMYSLPHHGSRTNSFMNQHLLNPENIPLTLEGIAQAEYDLHSTVLILKELGYTKIGLIGASLGGLVTLLYSSLSDLIDFSFVVVPAVDLREYLKPTSSSFNFKVDNELNSMTSEVLKLITPRYYNPLLSVDKIGGVLHGGDRLNNAEDTRKWAESWGVNLTEIPGGHWIYSNKKERGRAWYSWLKEQSFIIGRGENG